MREDRDRLHLLHIRDSTEKVLEYLKDTTFDDFKKREKDYDAILMRMVVIGEAVNDLTPKFKEKHHDLPWYEAVGLRNRIAHGYINIDPKVVWDTVTNDFPDLRKKLEEILK